MEGKGKGIYEPKLLDVAYDLTVPEEQRKRKTSWRETPVGTSTLQVQNQEKKQFYERDQRLIEMQESRDKVLSQIKLPEEDVVVEGNQICKGLPGS